MTAAAFSLAVNVLHIAAPLYMMQVYDRVLASSSESTLMMLTGIAVFLFLVLGIYFTWFWHKGQTLAMKTWSIRVVDTQGQALTQKRALLRYVLSWVWFLPPLTAMAPFHLSGGESFVLLTGWVLVWALLSRFQTDKQFWHDVWAGTRLVHFETPEPARRKA